MNFLEFKKATNISKKFDTIEMNLTLNSSNRLFLF